MNMFLGAIHFLSSAWRNVVQKTYGHKPVYLVAKENDEFKAILPMFLIKSRIFDNLRNASRKRYYSGKMTYNIRC